jgi:hypothetical protein
MYQLFLPWEGTDSYKKEFKLSCFKKENITTNKPDSGYPSTRESRSFSA